MKAASTTPDARGAVVLRLAARAPSVEAFVVQYSRYLHGDEIFLPTKAPALPGTRVRFSLELASGEPVIQGKGTVTRVHGGHPNLVPGMDVAFVPLDDRSRALVERMQQLRPESVAARADVVVSAKPPPPPIPASARSRPKATNERATEIAEQSGVGKTDTVAASESPVPANPFCEVSDGAIEYFVEWSLDQSTSERPEPYARFSNVAMARVPFARARSWRLVPTPYVAAAVLLGVAIGWLAKPGSGKPKVATLARAATASPVLAVHAPAVAKPAIPPTSPTAPIETAPIARAAVPANTNEPAMLTITTRPEGASVSVDGKSAGATPITMKVAPGPHEVSLTKTRYAPVSLEVTAPGKQELILKRPGAKLVVASTPSSGEVIIKGKRCGKTPLALDVDAFKSYDVEVAFPNGKVWRQKIYVKAPSTEIEAKLSGISLTRAE